MPMTGVTPGFSPLSLSGNSTLPVSSNVVFGMLYFAVITPSARLSDPLDVTSSAGSSVCSSGPPLVVR